MPQVIDPRQTVLHFEFDVSLLHGYSALTQQIYAEPFGLLPPTLCLFFRCVLLWDASEHEHRRRLRPIPAPGTLVHPLAPFGYLFPAGNNIFQACIRTHLFKCIVHEMVTISLSCHAVFYKPCRIAGKGHILAPINQRTSSQSGLENRHRNPLVKIFGTGRISINANHKRSIMGCYE